MSCRSAHAVCFYRDVDELRYVAAGRPCVVRLLRRPDACEELPLSLGHPAMASRCGELVRLAAVGDSSNEVPPPRQALLASPRGYWRAATAMETDAALSSVIMLPVHVVL